MSKWENNEEIEIFREYLRIPSVQPNVNYGTFENPRYYNPGILSKLFLFLLHLQTIVSNFYKSKQQIWIYPFEFIILLIQRNRLW